MYYPDVRSTYRIVVLARSAREYCHLLPFVESAVKDGRWNVVIPLHVIELPWQTPPTVGFEVFADEIAAWYTSLDGVESELDPRYTAVEPICLCAHSIQAVLRNLTRRSPIDEVIGSGRDFNEVHRQFGLTEGYDWTGNSVTTVVAGRSSNRMLSYTVLLSADFHAVRAVRAAVRLGGLRRRARLLLVYSLPKNERRERALHIVHRVAHDAGLSVGQYAVILERQDVPQRINQFLRTSDVVFVGVGRMNRLRRCWQGDVVRTILSLRSGTSVFLRGPQHRHGQISHLRHASIESMPFDHPWRMSRSS